MRRPMAFLLFQEIGQADRGDVRIECLQNLEEEGTLSVRTPLGLEDVVTMVPASEHEPNAIACRIEIGRCATHT